MACNCVDGGGNTGVPFCCPTQGTGHSFIIVPKYDSNGDLNCIDLENDTLDQAYFDGKVNAVNWQDRWYPTMMFENPVEEVADPIVETPTSGNNYFIRDGVRTYSVEFFLACPPLLESLESWRCIEFGVYEIDVKGGLAGTFSADCTKLYPRYINKGSLDVRLIKTTDTTVQKVTMAFQYEQTVKDSRLALILAEEISPVDLLNLNGLLDIKVMNGAATVTQTTVDLMLKYGTALNLIPVEGVELADVSIFNVTQSAAVVPTTVVEDPAGTYAIDYAAQTAADVLDVTITKTGYQITIFRVTVV